MTSNRSVWLTDAEGAQVEGLSLELLATLLDELADPLRDDGEHASVSLTDSDEWNLEFYRAGVRFENVGLDGEEIGVIKGADRDELLALGREFIEGDFEAIRSRDWASRVAG